MRSIRSDGTVSVTFVNVGIPYSSDGFVYQLAGDRWEVDPYNQFLVSPAEMMTGILRNWLQDSQLFRNVAEPGEGGGQTYVVDCDVTALYGDFRNPSAPRAVLTMEFQIFRRTSSGLELAMKKRFSEAVPFAERRPEVMIDAWNSGLRINLEQFLAAFAGEVE